MWWRNLFFILLIFVFGGALYLMIEEQSPNPSPPQAARFHDTITMTNTYAGGSPPATMPKPGSQKDYDFSVFDVSEGKRLYRTYNCSTCHANGGGDIGPPLMDDKWLYGAAPENIYASIVEGRPNGMPSFRGKIPEGEVWQLVAYIRAMSGHLPIYQLPGRNDAIAAKPPESMTSKQPVVPGGNPGADRRSNTP